MKEPSYYDAIVHSWQVVWHHKTLWALGLLSAFLGQFGLSDFFARLWFLQTNGAVLNLAQGFWANFGFVNQASLTAGNIAGLIWLGLLGLGIMIVLIFVAITAQGALIIYVSAWFKNKKYSDFYKAWHKSVSLFWSMFWVVAVFRLVCVFMLGLAALIIKYYSILQSGSYQFLIGFSLGLILFFYLVFSIIYIYSLAYVVVDNNRARQALSKAVKLFSRHLLVSLEVGVMLVFFNLVLFVLLATVLILAYIPALIIWIFAGIFNLTALAKFGFALGALLWIIMIVLSASVFNAFNIGAWTYLFVKMHKHGISSRIVDFFGRLSRLKK